MAMSGYAIIVMRVICTMSLKRKLFTLTIADEAHVGRGVMNPKMKLSENLIFRRITFDHKAK